MHKIYRRENPLKTSHLEDREKCGRIILKWILDKYVTEKWVKGAD